MAGGTVDLTNSILSGNTAQGGPGSPTALGGGSGYGGAIYVAGGAVTLASDTLTSNSARGGVGGSAYGVAGASGGNGFGGGLYAAGGTVTLQNDTVTSNSAQGGPGGLGDTGYSNGSRGQGQGGGLFIAAPATVYLDAFTQVHVNHNTASTRDPDIFGPWMPI